MSLVASTVWTGKEVTIDVSAHSASAYSQRSGDSVAFIKPGTYRLRWSSHTSISARQATEHVTSIDAFISFDPPYAVLTDDECSDGYVSLVPSTTTLFHSIELKLTVVGECAASLMFRCLGNSACRVSGIGSLVIRAEDCIDFTVTAETMSRPMPHKTTVSRLVTHLEDNEAGNPPSSSIVVERNRVRLLEARDYVVAWEGSISFDVPPSMSIDMKALARLSIRREDEMAMPITSRTVQWLSGPPIARGTVLSSRFCMHCYARGPADLILSTTRESLSDTGTEGNETGTMSVWPIQID